MGQRAPSHARVAGAEAADPLTHCAPRSDTCSDAWVVPPLYGAPLASAAAHSPPILCYEWGRRTAAPTPCGTYILWSSHFTDPLSRSLIRSRFFQPSPRRGSLRL